MVRKVAATTTKPVRHIPPRVQAMAKQNREWAAKAGPVVVVQAARCECGGWMRPGSDHVCNLPMWRHVVRHITGRPAWCDCGWRTPVPVDPTVVELVAVRHLRAAHR